MQFYLMVHDDVPSGMKQTDFQNAMCLSCLAWAGSNARKCANCGGSDFVFTHEKGIKLDAYRLKQLVEDSMK